LSSTLAPRAEEGRTKIGLRLAHGPAPLAADFRPPAPCRLPSVARRGKPSQQDGCGRAPR